MNASTTTNGATADIPASDALTLRQLGLLDGDDPRLAHSGENCYRFESAVRAGHLRTVEGTVIVQRDDRGEVIPTREREHVHYLTVRRVDFAAWLRAHGTDADRDSPAAVWARG